jgi:AcrR family transcriptional regulator
MAEESSVESSEESSAGETPSRRERILAVASAQFAEKGFAAVRIDEVAAGAEANKQLIYYYFGDKSGLYDATLEHMVQVAARFWQSMDASDLAEIFEIMSEARKAGVGWRRFLGWEGLQHAPGEEIRFADQRRASLSLMTGAIRRAQERGEVSTGVDPEMMTLFLICLNVMPVVLPQIVRLTLDVAPESDEYWQRQSAFLTTILKSLHPDEH